MMAPPLQAIVLAASSMLLLLRSSSAQLLSERPSSSPTTTAVASAPLKLSSPDSMLYSMQFRVGSTAVSGIIDTGSDLIWTNINSQQLFDSEESCPLDAGKDMEMTCCNGLLTFKREYGGKYVRGVMGKAKLTFAESSYTTPNNLNIGSAVMFGCHSSSVNDKGQQTQDCRAYQRGGIVGLGRGELSLVSQLVGLHSFSYCLPDHSSGSEATGRINFYATAAPSLKDAQTTELATIDEKLPYPDNSRYYLKLEKIVIDATKREVEVPNGCLKMESNSGNGGIGMIIDSGSTFTTLPKEAFEAIKKHVDRVMRNRRMIGVEEPIEAPGTTDDEFSCYHGKYPGGMGSILLQFCDGAQMEIPAENYLLQKTAQQFCLAIKPQAGGNNGMYILGVYQQRGMHMLFDIQQNTLSFAKASACAPCEADHATM